VTAPPPSVPGARAAGALGRVAHTFVAVLHTRGRLLVTELDEARAAQEARLLYLLVAGAAVAVTLLLLTLFVIVAFWDTHRLLAIGGAAGVYGLLAALAAMRAAQISAQTPPLLQATLSELEKDRVALRQGALARRITEAAAELDA
jgi:uncharacterized membrane protein YqjE